MAIWRDFYIKLAVPVNDIHPILKKICINLKNQMLPRGGGFSHWHGICICACLLGHLFAKFGIAIGGFSSETKDPKLHKSGVFWAIFCKKHPIWSKLGAFLSKMVYWWVGNLAKNWYRDSQIFEVRQAHPHTILVKEPPPPVLPPPPPPTVPRSHLAKM